MISFEDCCNDGIQGFQVILSVGTAGAIVNQCMAAMMAPLPLAVVQCAQFPPNLLSVVDQR